MIDRNHGWNLSLKPLYLGFTLTVIFLTAAYRIVTRYHLSKEGLFVTLMSLAVIQAVLQLAFFMHLGLQKKNHWYLITFLFTLLIIIIVVSGSLWIMQNIAQYETPSLGG
jgi:cytochrome o ubiquinol oxidase operon protein cyoD